MIWLYDSFFNHSPTEGHLGFFQFGAILKKVEMNFFFCEHKFSFLWVKSPRVRLLGLYSKNVISLTNNV